MAEKVYAIILAAGFSSRFGSENKLLVPFRGKPLALHTIDLICGIGSELFDGIFVVYSDERVAALANNITHKDLPQGRGDAEGLEKKCSESHLSSGIVLIHNTAPEKGQGESVRQGVEAAQANDNDFFLFLPCDQPFLDAATVRQILAARRKGCIVEPYCETVLETVTGLEGSLGYQGGSPCLFSGIFRHELMSLQEGEAPRAIKARQSKSIIRVMVSNPLTLADIDDREMMAKWDY